MHLIKKNTNHDSGNGLESKRSTMTLLMSLMRDNSIVHCYCSIVCSACLCSDRVWRTSCELWQVLVDCQLLDLSFRAWDRRILSETVLTNYPAPSFVSIYNSTRHSVKRVWRKNSEQSKNVNFRFKKTNINNWIKIIQDFTWWAKNILLTKFESVT